MTTKAFSSTESNARAFYDYLHRQGVPDQELDGQVSAELAAGKPVAVDGKIASGEVFAYLFKHLTQHGKKLQEHFASLGLDVSFIQGNGEIHPDKLKAVRQQLAGDGPGSLARVTQGVKFPPRGEKLSNLQGAHLLHDVVQAAFKSTEFPLLSIQEQKQAINDFLSKQNLDDAQKKFLGEAVAKHLHYANQGMTLEKKVAHLAVLKAGGLQGEGARRLFQAAAELNPDNAVARRQLAALTPETASPAERRGHLVKAIQGTKDNAEINSILQMLKDPKNADLLQKGETPWSFIADSFSAAGRHNRARWAFEAAAHQAADPAQKQALTEKAQLADEKHRQYSIDFAGANPVAEGLLGGLRAQKVPLAAIDRGGEPERTISIADVYGYIGTHLDDPRVQGVLKKLSVEIPEGSEAEIRDKGFGVFMAERHGARAAELAADPKRNAAAISEQLALAVYFQPDNPERHAALGDFFAEQGAHELAVRCYDGAARLNPGDRSLHEKMGDAYRRLGEERSNAGEPEAARQFYAESVKKYQAAIQADLNSPESIQTYQRMAEAQHALGDYQGAARSYMIASQIKKLVIDVGPGQSAPSLSSVKQDRLQYVGLEAPTGNYVHSDVHRIDSTDGIDALPHWADAGLTDYNQRLDALPPPLDLPEAADAAATEASPDAVATEVRNLLGPLLSPLAQGRGGALDLAKLSAESFRSFAEFRQYLSENVAIDGIAFNEYLQIPGIIDAYHVVLQNEKYEPLLRQIYAQLKNDPAQGPGEISAEELGELSREFSVEMASVHFGKFVSNNLSSEAGRQRLRDILESPENYPKSFRADVLEALMDTADAQGIVPTHIRLSFERHLSTWGVDELSVGGVAVAEITEEEIGKATDYGLQVLDLADAQEGAIGRQSETYLKFSQEVPLLKADGVDPQRVKAMAELVQNCGGKSDGVSKMQAALARAWLLVADEGNWEVKANRDFVSDEDRAAMIGKLNGFLSEVGEIKTDAEFVALNERVHEFLDDEAHEHFDGMPTAVKRPYADLRKFSDEIHHTHDMGGVIEVTEPDLMIEDPALREKVAGLVQDLRGTQRGFWYGYKQHKALSRVGSQVAAAAGGGDIEDIHRANREIGGLIVQLQTARSPKEVQAVLHRVTEATQGDGVIYQAFRAAEMDGTEQMVGLAQTVGEIAALCAVTGGLGIAAGGARATAALSRVAVTTRDLRAGVEAFRAVRQMEAAAGVAGAVRSAETVGAVSRSERLASEAARGFASGAYIATAENVVATASGELRVQPDTLLGWLKDALATGGAMAVALPLAPHAMEAARNNVLRGLYQRYLTEGARGGARFLADSGLEVVEEVVDAYTRKALDGNYGALSWDEMRDIVSICIAGGGAKIGALKNFVSRSPDEHKAAQESKPNVSQAETPATEVETSQVPPEPPSAPESERPTPDDKVEAETTPPPEGATETTAVGVPRPRLDSEPDTAGAVEAESAEAAGGHTVVVNPPTREGTPAPMDARRAATAEAIPPELPSSLSPSTTDGSRPKKTRSPEEVFRVETAKLLVDYTTERRPDADTRAALRHWLKTDEKAPKTPEARDRLLEQLKSGEKIFTIVDGGAVLEFTADVKQRIAWARDELKNSPEAARLPKLFVGAVMELAAKQPQAGEGRVKAIARSCLGQDYGIQDTPARFLARAQRDPDFAKHPQAVLLNVLSQTLPSLDVLQPLLTQIPVGQRAEVFGKVGGAIFDGTFTYLDAADYATERVMTPVFTDLVEVDQAVRERVLAYAERYKASFDIYEQARQRGYDSEAKPLDQSLPNNIVEEARMYIRLTNALFPNPMTHPETAHIYREPTLLLLRELSDFAFDHRIPTEDMIDFAESLQGLDQETQVQLLTYWFIEAQHPRMGTSSSDSASSGRGSRSQSNSLQARLLHEGTRLASSLRDLPVTSRREILEPLSDPASVSLIQMQEMASRAGPELSSSPESGEVPPSRLTGANVSTMPPPAMARSMARDASTVPPPARGRDASDVSPVSQVPATQASPRFDRLTDPADRADLATALLARHEAGFLEMSEADQAACRQYIQGHRDGLPLEDDPAFLRLQGEYEYNVRGELVLDDGSTRPIRGDLAYDTGGHAGANWDSRTGIVQSVDGGTVTVQNRNGQTLRLSAGIQSLQQHPFKPGDPVVLSLMAGGGLRPGERLGQPFPGNFAYVNDAAGHPTNERSAVLGRAFYPAMEQDPGISRQHAEIRWRPTPTGGQLLIQDLGSGNGTALFSDGRWIPIARGDAHPLEFGQVFQLGNNSFYRLNPDYTLQAVVNPAAAPGSAARVIQGNFTQIGVSSTGVVEVEGNGAHYQLVGHFSEVQPRSGVQMGTIHRATSDPRNPDWVHLQVFATSDLQQTPGIVHLILNREGAQALGVPFTNPDRSEPVIDASRPLPNVAIRRLTQTDQHSAARSAGAIPGDVASQPALGSPQTAPQGMPRLRSQRGEKIPEAMQDDGSVVYLGHIALRSFSDGTWVLTDTRDPATVRPWPKKTTDGISGPTELQINGEAIRPGQPTVVAPGDRIHVGFNILQLSVDRPAAFDLELAAVPGSAEITGSVEAARNFRELRSALETSGLPSAGEAVRALEQAVRGETTVDHLPQAIQEKTRQLMETLAQELRTHLPPGYEPFLGHHSTLHEASPVEQAYHAARAALLFQQQLTQARSVDEVRAAVDGTSLNNPMGSSRHILLRELDQYQSGQLPLQHFPTALRQKLRDIGELEMHRRHLVESRAPSYPADAGQRAAVQGLDTEAAALYTWVRGLGGWTGKVKGSAKDYKPEELAELVYRVVERGMPLEHLTTERGVRGRVEAHMQQVVAAAQGLYPGEWERAGRHNYFTGESLSDRNNQPNLQAQYRFARMMLNQQSGRPIFGEPTETEQATVRSFVGLGLTNSTVRDYGEAQEVIREHFARFTPELQQALRMVDPETRALVIEAYFGASQHRQVDDPHVAFRLSQFLGRIGFYREVGMTLNLSGGTVQTNLSLGDTGSVSPESDGLYFVLHTHPEEYVGKKGGVMGATDRRGVARTMVLGAGEQSGDTRNVVFSRQDVRLSVRAAQNLAQQLSRVDSQNISLLYDAERRVFQTWVQNPHGLAKMEVQLDGAGKPQEVRIRYGVYPSEGLDQNHVRYAERLRALSGELGIPVTVEQVDAAQVEAGLPY